MRSEMCSLHLTHPSVHTWSSGQPTGEQSWASCRSRDSNPQPWVTSGFKSNALSIRPTTALPLFVFFFFLPSGFLQPLVRRGVGPTHQLPRNASSVSGLSILSAGHTGTPCASTLRQQVRGVINKSPGRPRLEATLHADKRTSCVCSEQSALTEGDACAGQNEPRSRHVIEEQCLFRGMDAPPARGSDNWWSLW